jgi:hypothetical protein
MRSSPESESNTVLLNPQNYELNKFLLFASYPTLGIFYSNTKLTSAHWIGLAGDLCESSENKDRL